MSGLLLMENAGMRVVEAIAARLPDLEQASVVVLCGKGNNGGDGFVVARQLVQRGCFPLVLLFASPESVTGDARANLEILTRMGYPPEVVLDSESWFGQIREVGEVDAVVDAMVGTGLRRPLEGLMGAVVASLDDSFPSALIVSVDVPSGCVADRAELTGPVVEADLTVTFTALKHCLVFPPATSCAGEVVLAEIGNPRALLDSYGDAAELLTPDSFPEVLGSRQVDSHKGDYGRVLIVGGSVGKSGAAVMAGEAALRSGAGLVTVASARSALPAIAAYMPELMTQPLEEDPSGMCTSRALESPAFMDLLASASVLVVGPGIGRGSETGEFVRELIERAGVPTVIDADGIYAYRSRLDELPGGRIPIVLTPHAGEMAGLLGVATEDVVRNRLDIAREFAKQREVYIVLKGFRTVIATPDGRTFVSPTGNAAMATAGSGDVLAGMIAGILGQPRFGGFGERLGMAVYLHGLAGDIGAEVYGEESLTATDLVSFLPEAWRELRGTPATEVN